MSRYPDLVSCGIRFIHLSFHVGGGLEAIDAFWEQRGHDRSRERLLFAGYSRKGRPHTAYVRWARSHEGCCDVSIGLEDRRPASVWPHRPAKAYRLREIDFDEFIRFVRNLDVPWGGIRAHFAYPWEKDSIMPFKAGAPLELTSFSYDILDEEGQVVMHVKHKKRRAKDWLTIVEPARRFPFPEGDNFFDQPHATACSLAQSLDLKEERPS